jgi:protein gp37
MSKDTKIEWADHTFNPWIGCTKISPACDNCYAERSMPAKFQGVTWGAGQRRNRTSPSNWSQPMRWNAEAERTGKRPFVFCASLADVFDNAVPVSWRTDLFGLIAQTPHLNWLLLTKRIGNAAQMIQDAAACINDMLDANDQYKPLPNVWIGATVCNQMEADRDIPKLLAVPAVKRFLSIEPLLGPVDIFSKMTGELLHTSGNDYEPGWIDWIISGGESGKNARPMHPEWVRSLRDQAVAAGAAFFFKQWGEWLPDCQSRYIMEDDDVISYPMVAFDDRDDGPVAFRVGKKLAFCLLDGKKWNEVPA